MFFAVAKSNLICVLFLNRYGSITQASTVRLGIDEKGEDVYIPMSNLLPMIHPDDLGK